MPCLSYPQARLWGAYHLWGNFGEILRQQWCTFSFAPKTGLRFSYTVKKVSSSCKSGPYYLLSENIPPRFEFRRNYYIFRRNGKRSEFHVTLFHCFHDRPKPKL